MVKVLDISSGGICIARDPKIGESKNIRGIEFVYYENTVKSDLKITWENSDSFGLRFLNHHRAQKAVVMKIIKLGRKVSKISPVFEDYNKQKNGR